MTKHNAAIEVTEWLELPYDFFLGHVGSKSLFFSFSDYYRKTDHSLWLLHAVKCLVKRRIEHLDLLTDQDKDVVAAGCLVEWQNLNLLLV